MRPQAYFKHIGIVAAPEIGPVEQEGVYVEDLEDASPRGCVTIYQQLYHATGSLDSPSPKPISFDIRHELPVAFPQVHTWSTPASRLLASLTREF